MARSESGERAAAGAGERAGAPSRPEDAVAAAARFASVAHEVALPIALASEAAASVAEDVQRLLELLELLEDASRGRAEGEPAAGAEARALAERIRASAAAAASGLASAERLLSSYQRTAAREALSGAGRTHPRVRLGACVADALATLEPALRRRRLRAELREAEAIEGRVDAGAVVEVVLNLVVNAMRHAFPGATAGRVDVEVGGAADGRAFLRVRDSGRGIAPEDLPRVFEAGFTSGAGSGGTGLGLAIVREVVERRLRGSISCASVPGSGTTFEARFPVD